MVDAAISSYRQAVLVAEKEWGPSHVKTLAIKHSYEEALAVCPSPNLPPFPLNTCFPESQDSNPDKARGSCASGRTGNGWARGLDQPAPIPFREEEEEATQRNECVARTPCVSRGGNGGGEGSSFAADFRIRTRANQAVVARGTACSDPPPAIAKWDTASWTADPDGRHEDKHAAGPASETERRRSLRCRIVTNKSE